MNKKMFSLEEIKQFAQRSHSPFPGSHDWSHTLRVCNLCRHIAMVEGADVEVVTASAYLHDIGRRFQDKSKGAVCHAEKGAEIASEFIKKFILPDDKKENIIHSIRCHRFRGESKPETLEAKVLFDSDKLDAIGAVGIGRAFQFAGEVGAKLHNPLIDIENTDPYTEEDTAYREFIIKLSKIKDMIITSEGKRIAKIRHEFMELFFKQFLDEYEFS